MDGRTGAERNGTERSGTERNGTEILADQAPIFDGCIEDRKLRRKFSRPGEHLGSDPTAPNAHSIENSAVLSATAPGAYRSSLLTLVPSRLRLAISPALLRA